MLAWDKAWEVTISDSYSTRISPLIRHMMDLKSLLILVREINSRQSSVKTIGKLDRSRIGHIFWPSYSYLNLIESTRDAAKDYFAIKFREKIKGISNHVRKVKSLYKW